MNHLFSTIRPLFLVLLLGLPDVTVAEKDKREPNEPRAEKKERPRKEVGQDPTRPAESKPAPGRKSPAGKAAPQAVQRTFLGVATSPVAPSLREHMELEEGFGIQIHEALPESPAMKAGLRKHDILMQFEDQLLISPEHLSLLVRRKESGDTVELTVIRKGVEKVVEVTLASREESFFVPGDQRMTPGHQRGPVFDHRGLKSFEDYESWQRKMKEQQDRLRKSWFHETPQPPGEKAVKPERPRPDGKPPAVSVQPGFPVTVLGSKGVIKIDNQEGEVTITEKDGKHEIEIRDTGGKIIHEGEFDPEAGIESLPEAARDHLEKMKLENLEVLAPRSGSGVKKTNSPAPEEADEELL